MKKVLTVTALAVIIGLTGCAGVSKQTQGTIAGGAIGVGLGSLIGGGTGKTVAMILGGLFGAAIGSEIGAQLDERDQAMMYDHTQNTLEHGKSGKMSTWHNPDTDHSGYFTPEDPYETDYGVCRKFTQVIVIDGKKHTGHGVACRTEQGKWEIQ